MEPDEDVYEIDGVEVIAETDKALLIKAFEDEQVWIPKSVIDDDSAVFAKGDEGTLRVKMWFARNQDWC